MDYFAWKETGLTGDCASLEEMGACFEEAVRVKPSQTHPLRQSTRRQLTNKFEESLTRERSESP